MLSFISHFFYNAQQDDVDGRDPAMPPHAHLRQLAMGGRRGAPPLTTDVFRSGPRPKVLHRSARPPKVPLSSLHELQRGPFPQLPALLHRQSNGIIFT